MLGRKIKWGILGAIVILLLALSSVWAVPVEIQIDNATGSYSNSEISVSFDVVSGNDDIIGLSIWVYDKSYGMWSPLYDFTTGTLEYYEPSGHYEITSSYLGFDSSFYRPISEGMVSEANGFFIGYNVHGTFPYYKVLNDGNFGVCSIHEGNEGAGLTPESDPGTWAFGANQYGLTLDVILNQQAFTPGQTLKVTAHITNDIIRDEVNARLFVTLPGGGKKMLRSMRCVIPANADMNLQAYSYTFNGSEPAGEYKITGQFLDIVSGEVICEDTESFVFMH